MLATTLISNLANEVLDPDNDHISTDEWLDYLNDAQRMIVLLRPDASYSIEPIKLVAGTHQTLPANGLRLLDVIRNMGIAGTTPGKIITLVKMRDMDLFDRSWHTRTGKTEIKNYMLDERTPKDFYVTPPVSATVNVYIEIKMSVMPTEIVNIATDSIALSDIYLPVIRMWMLHRAFGKESDSPGSAAESQAYAQAFYNALGVKFKVDSGFSPKGATK